MSDDSYYDERARVVFGRITWAVQRLILINAAVFAVQLLLDIPLGSRLPYARVGGPPGGVIIEWLAFQPIAFLVGGLWKPFTYLFLHGGLLHLFLNMLWLFFFGPDVERALGTRGFIRFYLLCGVVGVFATFVPLALGGGSVSVVGASGAVMGVLIAFAIVNPEREFFLFPFPIRITARTLVIIVIAMNILTAFEGGSTSVATHFGGMITGYGYMRLVPWFRRWWLRPWRERAKRAAPDRDSVGEAVDNIFRFEDKKRRRYD
jgi:membrane associated rhomboid family serine protease